MSRVLAIANPKAGVGKTTTTVNLAACLVERRRKVLAIDIDTQASLTQWLGYPRTEPLHSIYDALAAASVPLTALLKPTPEGFDLVPAHESLNQAIDLLERNTQQLLSVRSLVDPIRDRYDYILIDCPADAGVLTQSALAAVDQVLIPLTADSLALRSLDWLLTVVKQVRELANPTLRVTGIFFNMFDPRAPHARAIMDQARARYRATAPFLATGIPFSTNLPEAARAGQSILRYDPQSTAAEAYRAFTIEIEEGLRVTGENELDFVLVQAKQALLAGNHELAYALYRRATELYPQLASGWSGRAASAAEWDEKLLGYGHALRLEPGKPERRADLETCIRDGLANAVRVDSLITVAQFLESIEENQFAHILYQRVVELDPRHEEAWMGQARTAADLRETLRTIERCFEVNPHSELARRAFRDTEELAQQQAQRLVEQGANEARLGNRQSAQILLSRACELDPLSDRAVLELARFTDDRAAASQLARKALTLNPQNKPARELYASLNNADRTLATPSPSRLGWVFPVVAMAVLVLAILALAFLPVSSLVAVVLSGSQAQATPTGTASVVVAAADVPIPTDPPPPAPTATPSPNTATATLVLPSATAISPTRAPTLVPDTATPRPPSATPIPTFTRIPTRTATVPPSPVPTLPVVLRYGPVILREPRDQQSVQQPTTTFEWESIALTLPGDHYELRLSGSAASGWEKSFDIAGGRFIAAIQDVAGYGDYVWSISILDAQQRVVSPASERRRLAWQPRPSPPGPPDQEPPPGFVKPPIFIK